MGTWELVDHVLLELPPHSLLVCGSSAGTTLVVLFLDGHARPLMGEPLREGLVNPERKAIRLITNQKSKKPQTRAEGCALNKKRWIDRG